MSLGSYGLYKALRPDDRPPAPYVVQAPYPMKVASAMDLSDSNAPVPDPVQSPDTHFALAGRYPISDMTQVKAASDYFEDYASRFHPAERREYAYNLCKRASELGVPEFVGEQARMYGGELSGDLENAKMAFHSRQQFLVKEEHQELLDKVAEKLPYLGPAQRLQALEALDKVAGLERLYDRILPDPYLCLHEKWASHQPFSEELDGEIILESELVHLAKAGKQHLCKVFSDEVVEKLRNNPVATYRGLPREQKKMMLRMAKALAGDSPRLGGWLFG